MFTILTTELRWDIILRSMCYTIDAIRPAWTNLMPDWDGTHGWDREARYLRGDRFDFQTSHAGPPPENFCKAGQC